MLHLIVSPRTRLGGAKRCRATLPVTTSGTAERRAPFRKARRENDNKSTRTGSQSHDDSSQRGGMSHNRFHSRFRIGAAPRAVVDRDPYPPWRLLNRTADRLSLAFSRGRYSHLLSVQELELPTLRSRSLSGPRSLLTSPSRLARLLCPNGGRQCRWWFRAARDKATLREAVLHLDLRVRARE